MSKFLKKIAELTGSSPDLSVIAQIRKKKLDNEKDPNLPSLTPDEEKAIAADDELTKKVAAKSSETLAKLSSSTDVDSEALTEQGPDDFIPRQGPTTGGEFEPAVPPPDIGAPQAPPPVVEPAEPLTTEGETFLVNLARKALHIDLSDVLLSDAERELVNKDAVPENSKKVAKVVRRIIVDQGLSECFVSKADVILEDLLKKNDRVVVLVPGSFKPPHKGHYEMVKQYSESYPHGQVQVLISAPSAKSERKTKDGRVITPSAAAQIFELYVQPLNNVTISISEYPSPVTAAYESLKTLDSGTTVVLGASNKDNDWKRWSYAQQWAEKEELGLDILDPAETAVDVTTDAGGTPYSASNIRDNFDDFDLIRNDIPDHVDPEEIKQVFDLL
jgi:nicotinamide mononucleotide adenylyltransferase